MAVDPSPMNRDVVGSLEKGLGVMEILAGAPEGMTLSEMADAAAMTRAGARRLLLTLVAAGYATQDIRKFRLSPKLLTLARTWVGDRSLWAYAEPFMREVSATLHEPCSATILMGQHVVYVARAGGTRVIAVELNVGAKLPAWCTSTGRVLLSQLSEAELSQFLDQADIRPLTRKSIIDREALIAAIRAAGRDGFAIIDEELEPGLRSIAVPLRDRTDRIVAAMNISTQAARHSTAAMMRDFLPPLRETARLIEGYFSVQ